MWPDTPAIIKKHMLERFGMTDDGAQNLTFSGTLDADGNAILNIPVGAATGHPVEYDQYIAGLAAQDEIDELADVSIVAIGNNEILQWDDPASKWQNKTLTEAGIHSLYMPVTEIDDGDSPYTALSTDEIISCDTSVGAIQVDLPAILGRKGRPYYIKNKAGGANNVTVDADGAETIDGALTQVFGAGTNLLIAPDSTEWLIL